MRTLILLVLLAGATHAHAHDGAGEHRHGTAGRTPVAVEQPRSPEQIVELLDRIEAARAQSKGGK